MKSFVRSIVFLVLVIGSLLGLRPQDALSQTNRGLGVYNIFDPHQPCATIQRALTGVPAIRIAGLWNTFGTALDCVTALAKDGRPMWLETHLLNEACPRAMRCGKYELLAGMPIEVYRKKFHDGDPIFLNSIWQNVAPLAAWYEQNPQVECRISLGLESNIDAGSIMVGVNYLRPKFPARCQWVWSPVGGNRFGFAPIAGLVFEGHGAHPPVHPPCIVNLDGVDIGLSSRPALPGGIPYSDLPGLFGSYASCESVLLWIAEFNGNRPGGFIDPRLRRNYVTPREADELNHALRAAPDVAPPWSAADEDGKRGCKTFLKIHDGDKRGFLSKQSTPPCCNRGLVTFIPTLYNKVKIPMQSVFVMKGKNIIARPFQPGVYSEDKSNRQFWRFHKLATDFPYNVVEHFGTICAVVPNPHVRND